MLLLSCELVYCRILETFKLSLMYNCYAADTNLMYERLHTGIYACKHTRTHAHTRTHTCMHARTNECKQTVSQTDMQADRQIVTFGTYYTAGSLGDREREIHITRETQIHKDRYKKNKDIDKQRQCEREREREKERERERRTDRQREREREIER